MLHPAADDILDSVRRRISDRDRVTDSGGRERYPPTTLERVRAAESALGFALPPLLTRLYTEVANGGFGPGYGLAGIDGCGTDEKRNDIVALHRGHSSDRWRRTWPRWPERVLRLAYLGCAMHACIDCGAAGFPVLLFEPNSSEEDLGFANNLVPYEQSFDDWMRAWAAGENVELPPVFRDEAQPDVAANDER